MRTLDVVVVHKDKMSAQKLADSLANVFRSVQAVNSVDDLRGVIARKRVPLIITDLETVDLQRMDQLQREFGVQIVCTHRIPDEQMWAKALSHGAIDCCHTLDVNAIIQAVNRNILQSNAA